MSTLITIGRNHVSVEQVGEIANGNPNLALSDDADFSTMISKGADLVKTLLEDNHVIYGVNTGVGDNCGTFITPELRMEMPAHVIQFHGCALGRYFEEEETRAIMISR